MRTTRFANALAMALAGAVLIALSAGLRAQGAQAPKGEVILTVSGDIDGTNRVPSDGKRDGFLAYHDIAFTEAFEFDRAMLDALDQGTVRAHPPQTVKPVTLKGARLGSLLEFLGGEGSDIRTVSLDGFVVEIDAEEIAAKDWILAMTMDGKPLGIGAQGPVWLVHTPSRVEVPEEEEQGWPWAVFYIEVRR